MEGRRRTDWQWAHEGLNLNGSGPNVAFAFTCDTRIVSDVASRFPLGPGHSFLCRRAKGTEACPYK